MGSGFTCLVVTCGYLLLFTAEGAGVHFGDGGGLRDRRRS